MQAAGAAPWVGCQPALGARELRRRIRALVATGLASAMPRCDVTEGDTALAAAKGAEGSGFCESTRGLFGPGRHVLARGSRDARPATRPEQDAERR